MPDLQCQYRDIDQKAGEIWAVRVVLQPTIPKSDRLLGPEDIILRENPSKAAVLEEFLHGTQQKLGIVDKLGTNGLGSAETHVKDFMIRHQDMLGLSAEDVRLLQILRDMGL